MFHGEKLRLYLPDQEFLLPSSLRDWLPENHLVYSVSDVIDNLNLSAMDAEYGEEQRGIWASLALSAGHRQTRDRNRLASQGISPFLDLEDPARPDGSACCFLRGLRSDPQDEP